MKKYFVYVEDNFGGEDIFYRLALPAKNEKEAKAFGEQNGRVIKVEDVTERYYISLDKVSEALQVAHFGEIEIDFILRTLSKMKIAE